MDKLSIAAFLNEIALIKEAGPILEGAKSVGRTGASAAGRIWGAAQKGAATAAEHLEGGGPVGRAAGALVRLAPVGALAYGGYKAYQSNPIQNLRYKWQMHKARQAMEQGGYQ